MKKHCLMFLIALALSLSTLLLCGGAMAEWYIVNVENYSDVQRYCESFILTVGGNTVYNSGENGVDSDINPSANDEIRIVPSAGCSVEPIRYRYTESGIVQTASCTLYQGDSGEVTTYFPIPLSDVDVMVIMTHPGVLSYKVEGSYAHCDVTLSDAEQTGSDSLYVEPGSTVTVTASPLDGYFVESMSYTTFSDPILKTIQFTTDADGVATGTLTMPEDPVYLSVNAILFPVPCISYDSTGHLQGEQICRSYTRISSGNPTWLDFNDAYGGWYVVKNDATLGSDTTIRITGDVKLILCDGATLTVGNGIYIKKGSSLPIYGQRDGQADFQTGPRPRHRGHGGYRGRQPVYPWRHHRSRRRQ